MRHALPRLIGALAGLLLAGCPHHPPKKEIPQPNECVPQTMVAPGRSCAQDSASEPNGAMVLAGVPPGGAATCEGSWITGAIADFDDIDVFRTGFCDSLDDSKTITASIASSSAIPLRVCIIPRCAFGATLLYTDCYADAPGDTAPDAGADEPHSFRVDNGFRGCCRTGPGSVSLQAQCANIPGKCDLEAYFWIDSDGVQLDDCAEYTVSYKFSKAN